MKRVTVKIPCRIHASVKDMSKFSLGVSGGGGVGISIAKNIEIIIERIQAEADIINTSSELVVKHFLDVIRKKYNVDDRWRIESRSDIIPHTGFGSTGSLILGLCAGLHVLLDKQISNEDLVAFYLENVKEQHAGRLTDCFETGVGPWSVLLGGVVIVDEKKHLAEWRILPQEYKILLVYPLSRKSVPIVEEETLMALGKKADEEAKCYKTKLFSEMEELLRAPDCDYPRVLSLIGKLQRVGSKSKEIQFADKWYNGLISDCLKKGQAVNVALTGLSSVGPTVFCIDTKEKIDLLYDQFKSKRSLECEIVGHSKGIQIIDEQIGGDYELSRDL